MEHQPRNRDAAILEYASISANILEIEKSDPNSSSIEDLEQQRSDIASELGMSSDEIILEARRIVVK